MFSQHKDLHGWLVGVPIDALLNREVSESSQAEQATAARQQYETCNCCEFAYLPGFAMAIKNTGNALSACHHHVGSSKFLQQHGMLSVRFRPFRLLAIVMFNKPPWNIMSTHNSTAATINKMNIHGNQHCNLPFFQLFAIALSLSLWANFSHQTTIMLLSWLDIYGSTLLETRAFFTNRRYPFSTNMRNPFFTNRQGLINLLSLLLQQFFIGNTSKAF